MRKRLGADRKSADGIVVGLLGQRRPEGNEQVRLITISRCGFFGHQSPYGDQPVVAVVGSQWLESSRQRVHLKLVLNRLVRTRMLGGVGGDR